MRKHETCASVRGREQHYLDVNGFSYWTMGGPTPLGDVVLINRQYSTHGAYDSPFDAIAHRYDDSDEYWRKVRDEREALYAPAAPSGRVLDVGCGTGLLATTATGRSTASGTSGSTRARGCWRSSR